DRVPARERSGALLAMVRHRDELGARVGLYRSRVEVLDPAGPDQRHPHGAQPFTPVSVMPSMNAFCAIRNKMITGSMNTTEAAICWFHRTPRWIVVNCWSPTDKVHILSLLSE